MDPLTTALYRLGAQLRDRQPDLTLTPDEPAEVEARATPQFPHIDRSEPLCPRQLEHPQEPAPAYDGSPTGVGMCNFSNHQTGTN